MIREISYLQSKNQFKYNLGINRNDCVVSHPIQSPQPISKYSLANIEANYLLFKNNETISFGGSTTREFTSATVGVTNISTLRPPDLIQGDYYENTANNMAILIGPDKNVLLEAEEDINSEVLVKKFVKNIKSGKYEGQGLARDNTEVVVFDAKKMNSDADDLEKGLTKLAKHNNGKKKIAFVDGFEEMVINLNKQGRRDINKALSEKYSNILMVGVIPKQLLLQEPDKSLIIKESLDTMEHLDFHGIPTNIAGKFLLENQEYLSNVFARYPDYDVVMTPEAIDEAVKQSSTKVKGTFPNKVLRIADYAAAMQVNKASQDGLTKGSKLYIDVPEIKDLFENHSQLIDSLRSEQGRYRLVENVKERLSDIVLDDEVEIEMKEVIDFAKNPKEYIAKGGVPPRGILLAGSPGNGKSLLARVIAGETGIPFISTSGSNFVELFAGSGAKNARELQVKAEKTAINSGSNIVAIFIDEVDAVGRERVKGSLSSDETDRTLNQILVNMDGLESKGSNITYIWIAATNRDDILDPALLRRFDKHIHVSNPKTDTTRLKLLNLYSDKLPFKFANEAEKKQILTNVAKFTADMSGDDLKKVMEKASQIVFRRADNKIIEENDVIEGFLQVESGSITKRDDIPIEELRDTIRHEGRHACVMDTLQQENISFITNDARGDFLGAVFYYKPKKITPDFKSIIFSAAKCYAGMDPVLASRNIGAKEDLKNATELIENAITKGGMGIYTPHIYIGDRIDKETGFSNPLWVSYEKEIKKDIELFSKLSEETARKISNFNEDFLTDYVNLFEKNAGKGGNTLSGDSFHLLRRDWLTKENKIELQKKMVKEINKMVDDAYKGSKTVFSGLIKRTVRKLV